MEVLIVLGVIFFIIFIFMSGSLREELTDDYFKIAGITVWLKDGIIQKGDKKMDVKEIRGIALEARGFPSKIPTVVVYFDSLETTDWEIAQYTSSNAQKANTVMRKVSVAIEKAGGPRIVF